MKVTNTTSTGLDFVIVGNLSIFYLDLHMYSTIQLMRVCIRREQIDKGEKKWRYLVCNIYILVHDMTNSRHWIQSTDDEFVPIFVEYFNRIIYGGNFFSHSFPSRSFSVSSWKPTFINEYLDVKYVGMGIPIFFSFLTWYLFSLYITFPAKHIVHSFFYIRSSILCCHFHQDD